jgi:hypothetical protein
MPYLPSRIGIAVCVMSGFLTLTMGGASAPYVDRFDSYPNGSPPANFTGAANDGWFVSNPTGSSGNYINIITSTPVPKLAYSEISLGNVAGRNFTVSTKFTAGAFTNGPFMDASVGLIALSSSDPNVFPTQCYTLEYIVRSGFPDNQGTFTVRGGSASWQGSGHSPLFDIGKGFTMSLQGEYVGGALFLTATLSNGINAISFNGMDEAPLSGPYFGFWDRVSGTSLTYAQLTVAYDDFVVRVGPARFGTGTY